MSEKETNFDAARAYLTQFDGGEITLSKEYMAKGIALLILNNPTKKNAMSGKMMVEFRDCIQVLKSWQECKAVLLYGQGENFCSGGDLDFAKASGTPQEAFYMSSWMQDALTCFQQLPILTVCLINGPTLGGGAEISISCDYIIATNTVKYGFVHGKMGIITAWGGAVRLAEKLGRKKALDLLLTGKILSPQECVEYEIAEFIVSSSDCLEKSIQWIEERITYHHSIVRAFKSVLNKATMEGFQCGLQCERELISQMWGAELNQAALAKKIKHIHN